jgi:hypothetical protein
MMICPVFPDRKAGQLIAPPSHAIMQAAAGEREVHLKEAIIGTVTLQLAST